jgi:hypothetical protein
MVDNQHKKITGYRDLSEEEIAAIQEIKSAEVDVANLVKKIRDHSTTFTVDMRNMALACTYLEEGFSRFVKAVARPSDPYR